MASHIGKWIYLDWTKELKAWCAAKVLSFKPSTQMHEVQFTDGEREWADLTGEGRRWTEDAPKKVWKNQEKRARRMAREYGIKLEMSGALLDAAEELLDMEDRLPNQGVKSQLPKFWENLRKQILRCKVPKEMAAAAFKFASQIKDTVLMDDWQSKAAQWKGLAKQAVTEEDVAAAVHQIKYKMVNWAQCRALFPSFNESKPQAKKAAATPAKKAEATPAKKAEATPVKKPGKGHVTVASSSASGVAVECNKKKGEYQPQTHMILCLCADCAGAEEMTPPAWERHVGCRTHNWTKSIKLCNTVGRLHGWIQARRQSDPPLAFHQMSPEEKSPSAGAPAPRVLPQSKVSQLPPQSAARLRQQSSHPDTGQLSPKRNTRGKAKSGTSAGKRKLENDGAESSDAETSSPGRPAKRTAPTSPAHQAGARLSSEPTRETPQAREETPDEEGEGEDAQLTCVVCDMSTDSHDILQCDGEDCGRAFHIVCLTPQLLQIPDCDWFCPACLPKQLASTAPCSTAAGRAIAGKTARGLGSPAAASEDLESGLGFFQTLFDEGPANHPLFADTEPQCKSPKDRPEKLEELLAPQPPTSTFVLPDDMDDDDALMAFTVPGSAYAAKLGY
ncbi:hypothetical protein KFL_008690050 [Klebsormidium nitens]|uniref:PHD-type domain-containing protein n=1 Tax=Klebsormidium nitens TaxID=105231 RepID=A0A1Y1IM28_KLENI|nr:hypothetical protein KFL_008690050 [Klebsormidium nitens]|eukprot:GAQ91854.1 hypothetical protein KFL_008690050 [Klebsormidium nitens]